MITLMAKVLFFAKLREQLNCEHLTLEVRGDKKIASIKEEILEQLGKDARQYIFAENILCSINHEISDGSSIIHNDDEIAFFPPVTGG